MKAFCIGRNYVDHAKELQNDIPDEPVVFIKHEDCFFQKTELWYLPPAVNTVHYEAEVVFRFAENLTSPISSLSEQRLYNLLDSVTVGLDLTDREKQSDLKKKGLPWEKCKSFKNAAILGEFISLKDENMEHDNIEFSFSLNGNTVQKDNTSNMIFKVSELICHLSTWFNIKKGDLLFTGTPAGVGLLPSNSHLQASIESRRILERYISSKK